MFDSLKEYEPNIRRGSICIVNHPHYLKTKNHEDLFVATKTTFVMIKAYHSYDFNQDIKDKEINIWFTILVNGRQLVCVDAYNMTNMFQVKSITCLED